MALRSYTCSDCERRHYVFDKKQSQRCFICQCIVELTKGPDPFLFRSATLGRERHTHSNRTQPTSSRSGATDQARR